MNRRPALDPALDRSVVSSPFVASWIGRARPGDRFDPDPVKRAAAWAHWAMTSLAQMTGVRDRSYPAFVLDGKFYDPKAREPLLRPHLEIPERVRTHADVEFADRLGQAGNALAFNWWVRDEVTAARRAVFNVPAGPLAEVLECLNDRLDPLVTTVRELVDLAAPRWGEIERLLQVTDDGLSADAAGDFSAPEVSDFFAAGAPLGLHVVYDERLRESARQWASRRVGIWQLRGTNPDGSRFALGVLTPRLTANSQFKDRLFAPERESAAALLVRGLLLSRLVTRHLGGTDLSVGDPTPVSRRPAAGLRCVVAQVGHKLPEASVESAVNFLQTYPDANEAWAELERWTRRTRTELTVRKEGFIAAHQNAARFLRRAETPERDDLNVVCPLGWDHNARVVRVTFSRPAEDEEDEVAPR